MRTCGRCERELDESAFNLRSSGKPYRQCKECRYAKRKETWAESPETLARLREYQSSWYNENRERVSIQRKSRRESTDAYKWYYLWNVYRIRQETYEALVATQGGVCAICKKDKKLYVDHDHNCCPGQNSCGKCIRGLICQKCNMFMHYIDEYDFFTQAIKHSKNRVDNPDERSQ